MNYKDKVAVVTGGGNGIGRELVLALLERGARVAAVDLNSSYLDETQELTSHNDRLSLHTIDVTDRTAIEALPAAVIDHHGAVDILINNAGIIQPFVRLAELEYEAIERTINVNLYGTIYSIKAFLPHLLERPEAHISNVSSMGGFLPVPGQTIYGAAKAGVKLMTEGLYAELLDTNVGVSVVMPGAVATNIVVNSGIQFDEPDPDASGYKSTPADEAARIILDGIAADKLHILVGSDARLMSLASRIAPKSATHFIRRQMKDLLG